MSKRAPWIVIPHNQAQGRMRANPIVTKAEVTASRNSPPKRTASIHRSPCSQAAARSLLRLSIPLRPSPASWSHSRAANVKTCRRKMRTTIETTGGRGGRFESVAIAGIPQDGESRWIRRPPGKTGESPGGLDCSTARRRRSTGEDPEPRRDRRSDERRRQVDYIVAEPGPAAHLHRGA